ncbi:hypothetical protein H0W26_01765 [Candidatus Dependentiae bacterium]|nr:hypothetical protein [Candidatus Dependentiae bacterium]
MLKKGRSLTILCILTSSLYGDANYIDENTLLAAIKNIDKPFVIVSLAENKIKNQESKECLLDAAEESVEKCEKGLSLWRSRRDLLKYLSGAGLVGYGVFNFMEIILTEDQALDRETRDWKAYYIAKYVISMTIGGYIRHNGWTLTSASSFLEDAKHIQEAIEKAPIAL